ncbi:MAG: hypothetical protein CVV17_08715, partial [Gammaproteobacteria bacterium HGW-Gammaproteobacteria-7]
MAHLRLNRLAGLPLLLVACFTHAADKKATWDVESAHGPSQTVQFSVDQGTWLDLDLSPDGRTLAFSMLGDIYLLPIEGGQAKRLTGGRAWDV